MHNKEIKIIKSHLALEFIKPYLPENPIIVEAGAFKGHDTLKLANMWPRSIIHAFEPVPELFEELQNRTANIKNIHCYKLALSNHDGTATFHISEHPKRPGTPSQAGSLLKPKERLKHTLIYFTGTIEVPTITLDSWAEQNNINHVDFLWLDMQGHELAMPKASSHILKTVQVIHTEVEFIESYENNPQYEEVKNWLESNGFTLVAQTFDNQSAHFFGNVIFVKKP